jgi:hypothetical protein
MRTRVILPLVAIAVVVSLAPGAVRLVRSSLESGGQPTIGSLERRVEAMSRRVGEYERIRNRMYRWWRCIKPIEVDQAGDPGHEWGFEYDERDGTGLDTRSALVVHKKPGRPDLLLLRFRRKHGCVSRAPDPNGTGADARTSAGSHGGAASPPVLGKATARLRQLGQKLERLDRRIGRLERAFDRFDQWESCLSWLPVTEYGHTYQNLGFLYGDGTGKPRYLGAIDIDGSEWDDPDYELLAFVGRDRPFVRRECGHEPGESVDRTRTLADDRADVSRSSRGDADQVDDIRSALHSAREDLEDLVEPVQEFVQFDECMFTVGVQNLGTGKAGYHYVALSGARSRRAALSFDMSGLRRPQWDVMAFPGEEPPQIECNEDASGQGTDE